MEEINTRLKELRKACHKTQIEWGKILGISSSGVADLESGRRSINEKHLIMLSNWHEKKVNIEWLRTGEGGPDNMFLPPDESDLIVQAKALLGEKDTLFESLILTYSKLTAKNKKILLDFFNDFSNTLLESNKEAEPSGSPDESAVEETEAAYIKSRSASARKKGSSASNTTGEEGDTPMQINYSK